MPTRKSVRPKITKSERKRARAKKRYGMSYRKHSDAEIADALRACAGLMTLSARKLGCDRTTIWRHVEANPELKRIVEEERELTIDLAEASLRRAIQSGEAWSVCFALKTIGRSRGFVERQEITATFKLDEMTDEEIAKLAAARGIEVVR